jgi:3,4-dihydroxy-2-butanone 4-phosphate synthase
VLQDFGLLPVHGERGHTEASVALLRVLALHRAYGLLNIPDSHKSQGYVTVHHLLTVDN